MKLRPAKMEDTWMPPTLREFDAILRTVFLAFCQKCFYTLYPGTKFLPNWHHEAIAAALSLCGTENNNRLLINLPPRHMKSELVSVFYTAWLLGQNPALAIVSICYGDDLTRKLSRDVRKIMQSEWYVRVFPMTQLSSDKCTETILETTVGGGRRATTVRGELIGHGADLIIIDDPHPVGPHATDNILKATIDWYKDLLVTRLTHRRTASIIVVMQRSKPNDLTGYLLQTPIYRQLKLSLVAVHDENVPLGDGRYHERKAGDVLHPAWLDTAEIDILKQETSAATFEALYQQDPQPNGGALLRLDRFSRYGTAYKRSDFEWVWQVWDCASSLCEDASYSVCVTFGLRNNKLLVVDVWRKRVEYPELLAAAHRLIDDFAPTHVVVERASLGQSLLPDLQSKFGCLGILKHDPRGDKLARAESVIRHFMDGRISLPTNAHFLAALSEEIASFPNGFYDDQIDCLVMALIALDRKLFHRLSIEYRAAPKCRGYASKLKPNRQLPNGYGVTVADAPSPEAVHRDLQARILAIHEEPHWTKGQSQMIRENDHDIQLARRHLLSRLDVPQALMTAKSFRAALQELSNCSVPADAYSTSMYEWAWRKSLELLQKEYADRQW